MYFFSIKNDCVNIIPIILGGVNNLKIIGEPTINNTLRIVDRSILKIKDINWQLKINDAWETYESGDNFFLDKTYNNKELRIIIVYFDEDGFLDNLYLPYFNISDNDTFNLPKATQNKEYNFKFDIENDDELVLESEWLNYKIENNVVSLNGVPNSIDEVNFFVKNGSKILRNYLINVENNKSIQNNSKNKKIIINQGNTDILVDELYLFKLKTNETENIKFDVEKLPRWLNFIDNKDGTALISGIPSIDNIGDNTIKINASHSDFSDTLEYAIKVVPDKTLPILKEISNLPEVTNAKHVYYYFNSSKNGSIIYEGNIKSKTKTAKIGYNKILLQTSVDGIYSGAIRVKDSNRNISKPLIINSFKVDKAKPQLVRVSIESNGKNSNYAKLNDTIKLKIIANKPINKPSVIILNRYAEVNIISKTEYEATYKVGISTISKDAKFKIKFSDYLNNKGDEVTQVTDESFVKIDMTRPKLNSVKITSSNENKSFGIIDDVISLELQASEPINIPDIEIFGDKTNILKINESTYIGKYTIKPTTNKNNELFKIEYDDLAGNVGDVIKSTTDKSSIEINTKKINLKEVNRINFTTNPEIEYKFESDDNGFIEGFNRVKSDITNVVKGVNTLKFNLEDGIYNNAKIYIKNDIGNITELEISEFVVNSKEIKPDFEYVILKSNGNNNDLAVNDIITLHFKTNKIVNYPLVTFNSGNEDINNDIIIKNVSDLEWTAEYIVHENDNFGSITFSVEIIDKFNLTKIADFTTDDSYLLYNKESVSYIKKELNNLNTKIENIREEVIDCTFNTEILNKRLDTVEEFEIIKKLNSITKDNRVIALVGDEVSVLENSNEDEISNINYQWQKKGVEDEDIWIDIENEVNSMYIVREEDTGYNLRTKVSFTENDEEKILYPNNIYVLSRDNQVWNYLNVNLKKNSTKEIAKLKDPSIKTSMNLSYYCFHKSGSMFFYRLFTKITKDNNINHYSINNKPTNNALWHENLTNCIYGPMRGAPKEYLEHLKYIVHVRNPLDIMVSSYYSFGYTHGLPKDERSKDKFMKRRNEIQSLSIDEYCLQQKNINDINGKYNLLLDWIHNYKDKDNVFISDYDRMYYNFSEWLKEIFDFLALETYNETYKTFAHEFENSSKIHTKSDVTTVKSHHRSGLSKQYLVELKEETLNIVISKFSQKIRDNFDFSYDIDNNIEL